MVNFEQYHEAAIWCACLGVVGTYAILIYQSCRTKKRNEQSQVNPLPMNNTTNPNMINHNLWEWFLRHEIQCSEDTINQFRIHGYDQQLHLWPHLSHEQLKKLGLTDHQRHVWFSKDVTKVVHTLNPTSVNPMFNPTQNAGYPSLFQNTNPSVSMGGQPQLFLNNNNNGNTGLGNNNQQALISNPTLVPVQTVENEPVSFFQPQHSNPNLNLSPMNLIKEPHLIMESWACMLRHELGCPERVISNFHQAGLVSEGHWLHCTAEELALLALGFDYSSMLQWKRRFPPKKENIEQHPVIIQQQQKIEHLSTDILSLKKELDQCRQKLAHTIEEHKEYKKQTKKKEKKKHQKMAFVDSYQQQQYPQAPYHQSPEQYFQNGFDMNQHPQFTMYPPLYNPQLKANSDSDSEESSDSESNYYVEQEIDSSSLFM